ncbi:Uncharacterised protein [Chlamydia trachomatis]|nr:Uncharacterised protein [Chlamydia trachomatis]
MADACPCRAYRRLSTAPSVRSRSLHSLFPDGLGHHQRCAQSRRAGNAQDDGDANLQDGRVPQDAGQDRV